jgi:hypothetical protein
MSEVDRQQLIQFLTNLRDFVSKLFDTYAALFGEPGQLGSETWTHLQPNHDALIAVLRGQPVDDWPGPGQRYTGDLATLDRELAERGLTGTALQFKLSGFDRARQEWEALQASLFTNKQTRRQRLVQWLTRSPPAPGPVRKTLEVAKRGLKWGDVGLITLASFIHLGEPIKEAKEGVEALVEDTLALDDRALEQTAEAEARANRRRTPSSAQ